MANSALRTTSTAIAVMQLAVDHRAAVDCLRRIYAAIGDFGKMADSLLLELAGGKSRDGGARVGQGHWREQWEDLGWILDPRISGLKYQMDLEREKVRDVKKRRLGWKEIETDIIQGPQLTQVEISERLVTFEANEYEDYSGPKEVLRGDYVRPISQRMAEVKTSRMRIKVHSFQPEYQKDAPEIKINTPQPLSPQNEFVSFKPISPLNASNSNNNGSRAKSPIDIASFIMPSQEKAPIVPSSEHQFLDTAFKDKKTLRPPSGASSRRSSKGNIAETDYKLAPITEKPKLENEVSIGDVQMQSQTDQKSAIDIMAGLRSLIATKISPFSGSLPNPMVYYS